MLYIYDKFTINRLLNTFSLTGRIGPEAQFDNLNLVNKLKFTLNCQESFLFCCLENRMKTRWCLQILPHWNKTKCFEKEKSTLLELWLLAERYCFEKHWHLTVCIANDWWTCSPIFRSTRASTLQKLSPSEVSSISFIYSSVAGWICQFEQAKLADWQQVGSKRRVHRVEINWGWGQEDKKDCDSHLFDLGCWVSAVCLVKSLC